MKKIGLFLLNLIGLILLIAVVAVTGLLIAKQFVYSDYIENMEVVDTIPAIHKGFVPQGLAAVDETTLLHSGYNGDALEIHMSVDGVAKQILPVNEKGEAWEGHGGGIACTGSYVYVASESKLIVFRLADLLSAKDGDKVASIATVPVDTKASFCFADANAVYVGEYYREGEYETDKSHRFVTTHGEENHALVSCYPVDINGALIFDVPVLSISIPDQVQGFAIKGDTIILSRSWGLTSSKLDFYESAQFNRDFVEYKGQKIPLFFLDSKNLEKTVDMPAFSEGLDIVGDRVIVSFESACNKYIVGKIFFADKVISYPLPAKK